MEPAALLSARPKALDTTSGASDRSFATAATAPKIPLTA